MAYAQFDRVPNHYAGSIIQRVKNFRLQTGKRALAPTRLPVGDLELLIPRHFGFCFGVERAIHMAFSSLEKFPDKGIQMEAMESLNILTLPDANRDLLVPVHRAREKNRHHDNKKR